MISSQGSRSEQQEQVKVCDEKNLMKPFQPIMDWLNLFIQIFNDEKITSELQKMLKAIIKDDVIFKEPIFVNLPEWNFRRVWQNKKRNRREF